MNEKEYREYDAINYSRLSAFMQGPDFALLPHDHKSYFEEGHAFEALCIDAAQGSDLFHDRFFECDVVGKMPDKLVTWIEDGVDLKTLYAYNKDGVTLNKTKKTTHAYLDACQKNPGKVPMGSDQMATLNRMVANLMKMPIMGRTVKEIFSIAEFGVPIIWERDGIEKKALLDVFVEGKGFPNIVFDLKSTADMMRFRRMYRDKYWVQEVHYMEGVRELYGATDPFVFLTAMKAAPNVAQPFAMDDEMMALARVKYNELCTDFHEWEMKGSPSVGYLTMQALKPYFG